jgi:transcriptional regulator with XRE-family HTH domain
MQGFAETSADKPTEALWNEIAGSKDLNDYFINNEGALGLPGLGEMLRGFCRQKGTTSTELAIKTDIDRVYCYQICQGQRVPSRDYLLRLAVGLGLGLKECQRLLQAAGRAQLYPRDKRDACVVHCLLNGLNCAKTDEKLFANGFPTLKNTDTQHEKR